MIVKTTLVTKYKFDRRHQLFFSPAGHVYVWFLQQKNFRPNFNTQGKVEQAGFYTQHASKPINQKKKKFYQNMTIGFVTIANSICPKHDKYMQKYNMLSN